MAKEFKNPNRYEYPEAVRRHEMTITFVCDPVPGAWDDPEDFIRWAVQHNYVQKIVYHGEKA